MEFKKIQLNGFKSFADKTNFLIEKGLTGIVGPNGCGKSNIVESLRWVMGETSAKSMRGSGMEDVIFSGTSNKASKNIAEVSISVSNPNNEGPIQYRELDEVHVRRKIEKDKGSKFYINDKEVRARDAQMFFADLSTGAHSPSMISQGRIGALVTAKPTDRRAILEEAAGISGLHVRRHEAELRLNAAESNLKRADELRRQQERQLVNLQKQAEEATKYKLISEEIKKVEAGLGGGSMNAASILNFFIKKKLIKIKKKEIIELSKTIGSDVILGLYLKNLVLKGNGAIKTISSSRKFYTLLVKPSFGCSTKKIYSKVKKFHKPEFTSISNNFMSVDYLSNKKNDLELIAIESYPRLKSLKNFLVKLPNAKFVRMTGSGSTMIAYFNSSESCKEAAKKVKKQFRNYWCKTSKTI
ncbi:AAA family ATPase [Candidatus Pelagibacter sp.]|nr:AAA family ATPase [Candidatus Pelagibacter sp.]